MNVSANTPVNAFISYSHADKRWLEELLICLKPYLRGGRITTWSDKQLQPGAEWDPAIQEALQNADVTVFLVTARLAASDYVIEKELRAVQEKRTPILWIAVGAAAYARVGFAKYQCLNNPQRPLDSLRRAERTRLLVEIAERIWRIACPGETPPPMPTVSLPLHMPWPAIVGGFGVLALAAGTYVAYGPRISHSPAGEKADRVRTDRAEQRYRWIPPGQFLMGCSESDAACNGDEQPRHTVDLPKGFWMARTEVTVEAFRPFAEEMRLRLSAATEPNRPMRAVAWEIARQYCGWIGGRLPTEAEWEYAARAGTLGPYYGLLDQIACFSGNSSAPCEVAARMPNSYGLFDMLGNVGEWVSDWYDQRYYQTAPHENPKGPSAGIGRVVRGGSYLDPPLSLRVSFRDFKPPDVAPANIGFRCVLDQ